MRIAVATILGAGLSACGAGADSRGFEVQDSSGIRVATNYSPQWTREGEGWVVDSVPTLTLGVRDGDPEQQFFGLSNAIRLQDGTLVVSNVGSKELRFFSAEGNFVRAAGGEGAGPGEFGRFSNLRICAVRGDRLAVEDAANNRINLFDQRGEYVGSYRLEPGPESGGRPPTVVGCLSEDLLLGLSWPGGGILQGEPGSIIEGELHYVTVDTIGDFVATLAEVPTRPRFVNQAEGVIHYPFIPFAPEPLSSSGRGDLYLSTDGTASIERRNKRGQLTGVTRWHGVGRQSVSSVWDRFVEESLAEIQRENTRRRYARLYAQNLPLPDSTPAVQQLILDTEGNLWAERYRLPWQTEHLWDVMDPEGRWLGVVKFPPLANVFEIGNDYVLGREVDELGVERLVMLSVVKKGS